MILASPTEPMTVLAMLSPRAADWEISSLPERRGVDYLWRGAGRWWGVQRKTLADLLASCEDGRLTREIGQMRAMITMPMLAVEGHTARMAGFSAQASIERRLLSIQGQGIGVRTFRDAAELMAWIGVFYDWSKSESHETAMTLPKPRNDWGRPSNEDWQAHVLMSLPGIGPKLARVIVKHLGGHPVRVTATREELMSVPGIGPGTAKRILEVFGS